MLMPDMHYRAPQKYFKVKKKRTDEEQVLKEVQDVVKAALE